MPRARHPSDLDSCRAHGGLRCIFGVVVVGALVAVGAGTAVAATGPLAKVTRVHVFSHGACVLATFSVDADGQKVFDYPQHDVSCAASHNREDFADFRIKSKRVSLDATDRITSAVCDALFKKYTGTSASTQPKYGIVIYATNEPPSSRRYTCSLEPRGFDIDHSDLAVRGSAKKQ